MRARLYGYVLCGHCGSVMIYTDLDPDHRTAMCQAQGCPVFNIPFWAPTFDLKPVDPEGVKKQDA